MCLILLALEAHPAYRVVLAANRDEFYRRPTAPADSWKEAPDVVGGRDLESGGTWLGVTRSGRWAAVTNVRDGQSSPRDPPSRGHLVADYLLGRRTPLHYAQAVLPVSARYRGYNLLLGDSAEVVWTSNRPVSDPPLSLLEPGIYGLSNDRLDTEWPKVRRGKEALRRLLTDRELRTENLLEVLLDTSVAADRDLPRTGVPLELERSLSAAFVTTSEYGTRSSTALLVPREGAISFAERRFDETGARVGERTFQLRLL